MAHRSSQIEVYLEIGQSRTFAAAIDWPGWCRSGRDEAAALRALHEYGPRYARALHGTRLGFHTPAEESELVVVERLPGNATTDFGAPDGALERDTQPIDAEGLERNQAILRACWRTLDAAAEAASGRTLRKGPRGGGRDLAKTLQHVRDVDAAYLASLGGKFKPGEDDPSQALAQLREAMLTTLAASAHGKIPAHGPRGGVRWTPRYFVRRLAWHELDHAWEIEDRAE